jgi:hypothetical protein
MMTVMILRWKSVRRHGVNEAVTIASCELLTTVILTRTIAREWMQGVWLFCTQGGRSTYSKSSCSCAFDRDLFGGVRIEYPFSVALGRMRMTGGDHQQA